MKRSVRIEGEEAAKTIIETHGGTRKRENFDYFKSQVVFFLSQKMHLKCGVASKILGENSGFPLSLEAKWIEKIKWSPQALSLPHYSQSSYFVQ